MSFRSNIFGQRKTSGGNIPEVTTDSILFQLESGVVESYPKTGTVWTDLINGINCSFIGDIEFNETENSLKTDVHNEYLNFSGLWVPAGDFTFSVFLRVNERNTYANPGIMRFVGSPVTFFIFQGGTGRPWIRLNNSDVLRPGGGYTVPDGVYTKLDVVVQSGVNVKLYADATEIYSVNTGAVFGGGFMEKLMMQSTGTENVWADWKHFSFYSKALTPQEISYNHINIRNFYGN